MLRTEIEQLKWSSIKFWCYKWVCNTNLAPELRLHKCVYTQEKLKSSSGAQENFGVISVIWEAFILCTVLEMLKDFRTNKSFIVQLYLLSLPSF